MIAELDHRFAHSPEAAQAGKPTTAQPGAPKVNVADFHALVVAHEEEEHNSRKRRATRNRCIAANASPS